MSPVVDGGSPLLAQSGHSRNARISKDRLVTINKGNSTNGISWRIDNAKISPVAAGVCFCGAVTSLPYRFSVAAKFDCFPRSGWKRRRR
jgi:hypothetical protein